MRFDQQVDNETDNKKNQKPFYFIRKAVIVIPLGFEPKTYRLEICCSIQLSYGTICVIFAVQICKNLLKKAI
jgi:hypothetical protein